MLYWVYAVDVDGVVVDVSRVCSQNALVVDHGVQEVVCGAQKEAYIPHVQKRECYDGADTNQGGGGYVKTRTITLMMLTMKNQAEEILGLGWKEVVPSMTVLDLVLLVYAHENGNGNK